MHITAPRFLSLLVVLALMAGCGRHAQRPASALSENETKALAAYEKIRVALASDNPRNAKRAADELIAAVQSVPASDKSAAFLEPAKGFSKATALDSARDAFRALSRVAIHIAGDVAGFYVMTSPMAADSEWLQTTPDVDNPYLGLALHTTGELKK